MSEKINKINENECKQNKKEETDIFVSSKNKFITILFLFIVYGLFFLFIFGKDNLYSKEERRKLTQLETLQFEHFLKGEFAPDLEKYTLDQFPFRNEFRKIKSFANYNVFFKKENQQITIQDNYAIKMVEDYNYDGITSSMNKINNVIIKNFLRNNCYIAIVPDKSTFLNNKTYSSDINKINNTIKSSIKTRNLKFIDISNLLTIDDYYYTDTHWKQENIIKVKNELLSQMNNQKYFDLLKSNKISNDIYQINTIEDFIGVYASQAALTNTDKLSYLTNDTTNNCAVYNYETNQTTPIYDLEKIQSETSMDMYDIFLSGATPLLRIDNPEMNEGKTLIVFRDSFGSSLIPLLTDCYKTIYVVDLRYISASLLKNYIKMNGTEDVLFLYSSLIIHDQSLFKD